MRSVFYSSRSTVGPRYNELLIQRNNLISKPMEIMYTHKCKKVFETA